jgi:hypothetical protein
VCAFRGVGRAISLGCSTLGRQGQGVGTDGRGVFHLIQNLSGITNLRLVGQRRFSF